MAGERAVATPSVLSLSLAFELSLRAGQLIKLVPRAGLRLHCREGELLVTIQGDANDYLLPAGKFLSLPGKACVLLEGEGTFSLQAQPEGAAGFWQRFLCRCR